MMLPPERVRPCSLVFILSAALMSDHPGFQNVRNWLADVREHADPHVSCILVGNKVDLCSDDATSTASATVPTSASPPKPSTIKHAVIGYTDLSDEEIQMQCEHSQEQLSVSDFTDVCYSH